MGTKMKYYKTILILLFFFLLSNTDYYSQNFDLWDVQSSFSQGIGTVNSFYENKATGELYSVVNWQKIKKSTDEGETWNFVTEYFTDDSIHCVAADNNGKLFAGTIDNGIFYSSNDGANWELVNNGLAEYENKTIINKIDVDELNNVFAIGTKGLYKFNESEKSWDYIDVKNDNVHPLVESDEAKALIISEGGFMIIGFQLGQGIWKSEDYGETWGDFPIPWQDTRWSNWGPYHDMIELDENSYIITRGWGESIMYYDRSNDIATIQGYSEGGDIKGTVYDNEGNLYLVYRDGLILKSTDKGVTWFENENQPIKDWRYEAVMQMQNGAILVGGYQNGAFKTTNDFQSVYAINAGEGINPIHFNSFAIDSNDNLYLPIDNELKKSTDQGVTWTKVSLDAEIGVVYVYSDKEGFLLAIGSLDDGNAELFLSLDDGETWNKSIIRLGEGGIQRVLKIGGTILAVCGQQNSSLWKSGDNGASWSEISIGYEGASFGEIVKDSEGNIYITTGGIVLKSADLGENWTNITTWEYDPMRGVRNLYITEENSVLTMYGEDYNYSPVDYSSWYQNNTAKAAGEIIQDAQGILQMGTCYTGFLDGKFWLNTSLLNINYGEMICVDIDKSGNLYAAGNGSVFKYKRNTNTATLPKSTDVVYANREDHIKLYWSDNYDNEDGFIIMRRRDDTVLYDSIATVGANATNYQDFSADMNFDYSYRVMAFNQQNYSLPSEEATFTTDIQDNGIPCDWTLEQNYPNPFNPVTSIRYSIPTNGFVSLKIYDLLGNEISSLVNEVKLPGNYKVMFDGSNLSSGLYFAKLVTSEYSDVIKMLLIK
jgi:photosystem II stability/assembly factor-like uncharacterized protein